jgi:hypothetical protein
VALPPLATVAQLEARLGHPVDEVRAAALIEDASAVVRNYTRQMISYVQDDKIALRYSRGRVTLPERPAFQPTQVERADGSGVIPPVSWWWSGLNEVEFYNSTLIANGPYYRHAMRSVIVTYSHGYQDIPADIVAVVCQVVGRVIDSAVSSPGLRSEAIDDYKADLGGGLSSGTIALVPEEMHVLDRYRTRSGSTGLRYV